MKGLGLIGLLIIVVLFFGPKISGGGASKDQGASGVGLPVAFVSRETRWPDVPIKAKFNLEASDNWVPYPWPFATPRIYFACGKGALNVVAVGTNYAALNGHTSGLTKRYALKNDYGQEHYILSTEVDSDWKRGGLASYDATEQSIREWRDALNKRLLRECGR